MSIIKVSFSFETKAKIHNNAECHSMTMFTHYACTGIHTAHLHTRVFLCVVLFFHLSLRMCVRTSAGKANKRQHSDGYTVSFYYIFSTTINVR